jgi:hypothetical protein
MNLGDNWTPLTRTLIVGLFVLYVLQLLAGEGATQTLAWQPFGAGFLPTQPLTSFLIAGDPTSACLGWLGLFFLVAPVERALGRSAFARAALASWLGAVALGLAVASLQMADVAVLGLAPLLAALASLFGWAHPGANILLFFVIPIRAELIAWGTGALSFLWLLVALTRPGMASPLGSALAFGAWLGALAWSRLGSAEVRRLQLAWRQRRVQRELRRFEVIEGGRTSPPRKRDEPYH